jgi:hypothetical protein
VVLVRLVRVLYGSSAGDVPGGFSPAPRNVFEKRQNISHAFEMLERVGVRTPNTKHSSLLDHDLKMVLGLIWAIIQHHTAWSLSRGSGGSGGGDSKEVLLRWCNGLTASQGVRVENFGSSFADGRAFLAILRSHDPALVPDWEARTSERAAENLEMAFSTGEAALGIPRMLEAEDILTDEKAVITYVAQMHNAINVKPDEKLAQAETPAVQEGKHDGVGDDDNEEVKKLREMVARLQRELSQARSVAEKSEAEMAMLKMRVAELEGELEKALCKK